MPPLVAHCARVAVVAACLMAGPAGAADWNQPAPDAAPIALPAFGDRQVRMLGVPDYGGLSPPAGASIMYSGAAGVIGMVAQVLTHAGILALQKDERLEAVRQESERFGAAYDALLGRITVDALLDSALAKMPEADGRSPWSSTAGGIFEFTFEVTRDHSAVIVETFRKSAADAAPLRVRVIGRPGEGVNTALDWFNTRRDLRGELADLLAETLRILRAIDAPSGALPAGGPQKTFRYSEGRVTRFARGTLHAEHCGRVLFVDLRGVIVAAPVSAPATPPSSECAGPVGQVARPEPATNADRTAAAEPGSVRP